MKRWQIIGEIIVFLIHTLTGIFLGWFLAIGESPQEKNSSIFFTRAAFLFIWVITRQSGKYFFHEIDSMLHGATAFAVLGLAHTLANLFAGKIFLSPSVDLVIGGSLGGLMGGFYSWLR